MPAKPHHHHGHHNVIQQRRHPLTNHDHPGHHHHNGRGNDLYCPDDNCLAGLINSRLNSFHQFGPADHVHNKQDDDPPAAGHNYDADNPKHDHDPGVTYDNCPTCIYLTAHA